MPFWLKHQGLNHLQMENNSPTHYLLKLISGDGETSISKGVSSEAFQYEGTKHKNKIQSKGAQQICTDKFTQVKLHDSAKTNVANNCSTKCKAQSMHLWVIKTTRIQKLVQQVSKYIGASTSHQQTKPPNFTHADNPPVYEWYTSPPVNAPTLYRRIHARHHWQIHSRYHWLTWTTRQCTNDTQRHQSTDSRLTDEHTHVIKDKWASHKSSSSALTAKVHITFTSHRRTRKVTTDVHGQAIIIECTCVIAAQSAHFASNSTPN